MEIIEIILSVAANVARFAYYSYRLMKALSNGKNDKED